MITTDPWDVRHLEDGLPGWTDTWLITMVSFRPLRRVVPLPNGLSMAYKWRLLTTYKSWDGPPSRFNYMKLNHSWIGKYNQSHPSG